ncbi:tRNA-dihydrouridine synthase A [Candidatus Glomeribacter gigasporarum BEG34]|uniref:tRNA-dihydrouridine(20/20a) synthase n=1 Tax=Candidatus Glomeribacter gigasporarum BEG34 TaxID=1070319 RepID=G2J944_9BURK|nr:tRNA dihydrouridine(20/20a) synthase DusA [Candidatus Glomeribacter gigasporarum]CCD29291.1 tRNA-dihydrouridine synthase A [Candidatus Glomeribacter gigasporarum BEG34]
MRLCIAPMMGWTDRHCRYFHRLLTRRAWLYTEMVAVGALLHSDAARHLAFDESEHPVALQLGGSNPDELADCAKRGEAAGYDEINLNCGCPSARVQRGVFGAALMAQPLRVAECVRAMRDAVSIPVTVKHRIGLDDIEEYAFVRDFIGTVAHAGCQTFIVHARSAVLHGLNPKENRSVPPLRYEVAYRLKRDFPALEIILNGGVTTLAQVERHLAHIDGVMLGRAAYHNPWLLAGIDHRFYQANAPVAQRADVIPALKAYYARESARGAPLKAVTRHILGLYHGVPGARRWRRTLSDTERWTDGPAPLLDAAAGLQINPDRQKRVNCASRSSCA